LLLDAADGITRWNTIAALLAALLPVDVDNSLPRER
jgi:hypothetical protein